MTWAEAQRRLVALGYYRGRIDGDPGDGTLAGVEKLLAIVEEARGVKPPPPVVLATAAGFVLPSNFDSDYAWLGKIGPLPRVLQQAIPLYGLAEIVGTKHSPVIMGLARETGLADVYTSDEIAWCGLFVAAMVKRAGYPVVAGPLWALNWTRWLSPSPRPSLGDVLAFQRPGGGHVGFYIGEDDAHYHVLGGNQGNRVSIVRVAKDRLKGARRPDYHNPQPNWKPYRLSARGIISTDES